MAHGQKAAHKSNKQREFGSPRPGNFMGPTPCRYSKTRTHRLERRIEKRTRDKGE